MAFKDAHQQLTPGACRVTQEIYPFGFSCTYKISSFVEYIIISCILTIFR